jgi:hypothetical protein
MSCVDAPFELEEAFPDTFSSKLLGGRRAGMLILVYALRYSLLNTMFDYLLSIP